MPPIDRDAERETLLDQIVEARTLTEIAAAKEALHAWLQKHPDEPGMADAFEVLSHREDFARQQVPHAEPSRTVVAPS
jgi:hypothetical protein